MTKLLIQAEYKHKRTGNEYFTIMKTKMKINGEWKEGILYRKCGAEIGTNCYYTREIEDFKEKFELIT